MKNVKNILSALAFVFAIGAAFAFSAPNNSGMTIQAHSETDCSQVFNIPATCQLALVQPVTCTVDMFGTKAIELNTCDNPRIYTRQNP